MLRNIWSKSLRDYRVVILGWGIGLGLLMAVSFVTATPVLIAAFASIAPLIHFLGDPYALQTPEGYVTFRFMEVILPLLLSFWPILAGARLVRGEEECGSLDVLLATPQPRARLLLEKIGALVVALILIAVLFALGAATGEAKIGHANLVRALLAGLNLSLLAFFFAMVALLISQFTASRGAAAGATSGLLLLSVLLDMIGRMLNGSWVQYFSPFYYYNLNRPLIPGFYDRPLAALLLVGLSALCAVCSIVLFARRDIGMPLFSQQREPANDQHQEPHSLSRAERARSLRTVSLRTLAAQGWSCFWWLLGIVLLCAYIVLLTPSIQKQLYMVVQQTPWLQQLFFDTPTNTNAALLGTLLFSFLPILVMVFALILALAWTADLENGRLELIFSTPLSRTRILLERFGANVLPVLLASILTWLAIVIGALLINLNVDQGKVLAASISMLPPGLITLGLVYALTGRLRYSAVLGIATAYLAWSFLEENFEGMVSWPSWFGQFSIFHLYGNPIFDGMNWGHFLGMLGVAAALLVISLIQFRYVDIARG